MKSLVCRLSEKEKLFNTNIELKFASPFLRSITIVLENILVYCRSVLYQKNVQHDRFQDDDIEILPLLIEVLITGSHRFTMLSLVVLTSYMKFLV